MSQPNALTITAAPVTAFQPDTPLDPSKKFVRVMERRADGQVSFEFSIGWPELAVELMLPTKAFDEFCANNHVIWRNT